MAALVGALCLAALLPGVAFAGSFYEPTASLPATYFGFTGPIGSGVDGQGRLLVLDGTRIFRSAPNDPGTLAPFASAPGYGYSDLAVAPNGTSYVVAPHEKSVFVFDANGLKVRTITGFGGIERSATDSSGNLYALDYVAGTISVFGPTGIKLRTFSGPFQTPGRMTVGPDGKVYVADQFARGTHVFNADGTYAEKLTALTIGDFCFDAAGKMWAAQDTRLWRMTTDTSFRDIRFSGASSICALPDGRLIVTESGAVRVTEITLTADTPAISRYVGDRWCGPGTFSGPISVAVRPDGGFSVVDKESFYIQHFSATKGYLGASSGGPWVRAVAAAPDGGMWAVVWTNELMRFNAAGNFLFKIGAPSLSLPMDVKGLADGTAVVLDDGLDAALHVAEDGSVLATEALPAGAWGSLAAVDEHTFYAGQAGSAAVWRGSFDPGSAVSLWWSGAATGRATGMATDASGTVYVASSKDNAVYVKSSSGSLVTIVGGTLGRAGSALSAPSGVSVSSDGRRLLVADTNNWRIREFRRVDAAMTFSAAKGVVAYGVATTLTGRLYDAPSGTGVRGHGLLLYTSVDEGAHWTSSAFKSGIDGAFTFKVAPTIKTMYKVYLPEARQWSTIATVTPYAYLTAPVVPSVVKSGALLTAYGDLKPKHAAGTYPVVVRLYYYKNGSYALWKKVSAKAYDFNGYTRYSVTVALPYAGKWAADAYHSDAGHASSSTSKRYFTRY